MNLNGMMYKSIETMMNEWLGIIETISKAFLKLSKAAGN